MADYASEKGVKVQTVAGDPPAPFEGQVWYNSSTGSHRVSKGPLVGAWSTGGDMNTAKEDPAGAGTQTAALAIGGDAPGETPEFFAGTESYNGTSWTEVNDLNTGRDGLSGAGTQTSALAFGGDLGPTAGSGGAEFFAGAESYNGTNWTELNDLNTARSALAGVGVDNTAVLAFGGTTPPETGATESWNGTNWTEVNDLNTVRSKFGSAGTQTSALAFGGITAPIAFLGATESWNGTNWTEVNDLNTNREYLAGCGTQTSALAFGGNTGAGSGVSLTESWNGSNWTEVNDLNLARFTHDGAGADNTSALVFGNFPVTVATEEWGETGGNKSITSS